MGTSAIDRTNARSHFYFLLNVHKIHCIAIASRTLKKIATFLDLIIHYSKIRTSTLGIRDQAADTYVPVVSVVCLLERGGGGVW